MNRKIVNVVLGIYFAVVLCVVVLFFLLVFSSFHKIYEANTWLEFIKHVFFILIFIFGFNKTAEILCKMVKDWLYD